MQIVFQHKFELPVWRLISSASDDAFWVSETRNPEKKTVDYFTIDSDFNILPTNREFDWWSGVECIYKDKIIFHNYLEKDLPIHKGIKVYDLRKNDIIWENEYVSFVSINSGIIKAKVLIGSQSAEICLDIESGEEMNDCRIVEKVPSANSSIISEGTPYFFEIQSFVQSFTPLSPIKQVEYQEIGSYIIVSYFTNSMNKLLENYLLVTDIEGVEIIHICLDKELKGVITGTFSVSNSFLSFVKDRNELFIASLN